MKTPQSLAGSRRAIVLSPVMPLWDHGVFCSPLVKQLEQQGFRVSVIDTLSISQTSEPESALELFEDAINRITDEPILLVGFALGGTIAQSLASRLGNAAGIISVSGPAFATEKLNGQIGTLLRFLERGELEQMICQLQQYVAPVGCPAVKASYILPEFKMQAVSRMLIGFRLLLNLDARSSMAAYSGRFLSILGACSQLAARENQIPIKSSLHQLEFVESAGMRPWSDNPTQASQIFQQWVCQI